MREDSLPVLVAGTTHPSLGRDVAARLGVPLCPVRFTRFSNENLKVVIEGAVRDRDVFVLQTSCPPVNESLMETLILLDALRTAGAGRVTAVLPYFPYSRSDKLDEPGVSITARLVADLLVSAGAGRILTLDLHAPQIHGFFRVPMDHITAIPTLCASLATEASAPRVVVATDIGEAKDAGRFAARLGVPLAVIDKRRTDDSEHAVPHTLVGDVAGRHALIVDDEIATGGTILEAAEMVLRMGAASVEAAVVHPVLSGNVMQRLRASPLRRLRVTNTIPLRPECVDDRIEVVDIAPLIADSIGRIHKGERLDDVASRR
ncbi:MAG: ribose-phosphate pyrophosphokinase [Myxococcales bacterium]|nr:ribose-phosphate pyrophosphokinase [Myxococcales bacterium]